MTQMQREYSDRRAIWSDIVDHMPTLHDTVLQYSHPVVLELGTRSGNSTAALLAAVEEVGGHVWSVDIEQPQTPEWWLDIGRWTVVIGDDLDPNVAERLPEIVHVLFIDTSHTYDQTLAELRLYVPRVVSGGTVLLHDTELDFPDRTLIRPDGTDVQLPVARALDAYCAETGLTWVNNPGCYGLGQIRLP